MIKPYLFACWRVYDILRTFVPGPKHPLANKLFDMFGVNEAGIGVGDGVIGSRMREHPRGDDERGRSGRIDGSWRREMRVIGGGEGTQGSKEGGGSEQDKERRGKWLPWTQIVRGRTATPPTGR